MKQFWYRIERQNRGALHIHRIIWLKEGTYKEGSIVAEKPRGDDVNSRLIWEKVEKYQIHHCRTNRCYHTSNGKATDTCKYGHPFKLRPDDGYDSTGTRFEYMHRENEDVNVVSFCTPVLVAWHGHVNFQKIMSTGLERYLVK